MSTKKKRRALPLGVRTPKTPSYVIVELRHDSQVAYSSSSFESADRAESSARSLNRVLEGYPIKSFSSHFGQPARTIRERVISAPGRLGVPVSSSFAQAGFVQIVPKQEKDCRSLVRRLNRLDAVWKAVVAPKPAPAAIPTGKDAGSRNFEPAQGYLHSAPNGIGAMAVWDLKGARGEGVTICDIEGNWNFDHEDLPGFRHIGGELIDDLGWRNHGTAVLGEMVSKPSARGTVGICHKAKAVVHAARIDGVFNTARAILGAANKLDAGDVILIELQAPGPNGRFVAMQFWDDVFSAIRVATDKGITVVEAAGNGDENFDAATFKKTGLQKRSGAIVVGAGIPPTNYFDNQGRGAGTRYEKITVPRSRIWFSNYGKIVDVQAWGWHVTSTGYGDAQGGKDENKWYTHRFSGTSSASPIVTGAVACLQGRALAVKKKPLTPKRVREILMTTGTPQEKGPKVPLKERIGPQPNLEKAIKKIKK